MAVDDVATSRTHAKSSLFRRRLNQIRTGGPMILVRKIKVLLLLSLMAFPVVLLMRLLRPLVLIRVGGLKSQRIGHFAANTELYLLDRDRAEGRGRTVDIHFIPQPASNKQLELMWRRTLRVSDLAPYIHRANRVVPGSERHVARVSQTERDQRGLLAQGGPNLSFTPEEEMRGRIALTEIGVPEGAPYICFHVRDSAYLDSTHSHVQWQYHDFRDMTLENLVPAAEHLTRRGYYAIRVGSVVQQELATDNPMIIDYATKFRTDFLDIYLNAKCRFFLGTDSGIYAIATIFRRPVAWINFPSLELVHSWSPNDLTIPKKLWMRSEGRMLTFRETIESGAGRVVRSDLFEKRGLEVIENTPEEITALVTEMDERLNGTWETSYEDEELQRRFWSLYEGSELHGKISARIGAEFLRQNRDLLD